MKKLYEVYQGALSKMGEGNHHLVELFDTKEEAVERAKEISHDMEGWTGKPAYIETIVMYDDEIIESFCVECSHCNKKSLYADFRLLSNCSISGDTLVKNIPSTKEGKVEINGVNVVYENDDMYDCFVSLDDGAEFINYVEVVYYE